MENKVTGFRDYRIHEINNFGIPKSIYEKHLVTAINLNEDPHKFLQAIVDHPKGFLSRNEEKIVMTVIQWFGTNVGIGFYQTAMKKAKDQYDILDELERQLAFNKLKRDVYEKYNILTK